jgi:hypothetical protein
MCVTHPPRRSAFAFAALWKLLLAAGVLGVPACATISGFPKPAQNDDTEIAANQKYFALDVRSNEDDADNAKRGGLTRQQYRDAVVYGRLNVIDIRYFDFAKTLTGTNNGFSTGADLGVLMLNGFGATTGAAAAKAALAAASAGVVGAKATVNTDLFYQKTLPALIAQMNAGRQQQLVIIKTGLGKSVDLYPLGEALNDIQNYYVAGTLPNAVQQVTSNAGTALADATKQVKQITLTRSAAFVAAAPGQEALLDRIIKITPQQALAVYAAMKPKLAERTADFQQNLTNTFPGFDSIKDGATAKSFLQSWEIQDDLSNAAFQAEWTAALDTATE